MSRSEAAQAYRRLYATAAWRKLRTVTLMRDPLCRYCQQQGRITPATVCDHIVPHRGDPSLFFDAENLQSLCAPCHDKHKAREEARGYSDAVGSDGYPIDPRHPVNCQK